MKKPEQKITDWNRCRARIKHEDHLLNNRTNLFLVVNGLGAVAIGLTQETPAAIMMTVVILLANIFWIIGCSQSVCVLKTLTSEYIQHADDPIDDLARKSMLPWPRWMRNTSILGRYIPILITLSWGITLYILIFSGK